MPLIPLTARQAANSPLANGSLIPCLESACEYMIKAIRRMNQHDIKSMCIKSEAEADFVAYTDACASLARSLASLC